MSSKEPCLEGVSEEIKGYIEKLEEENNVKEIILNKLNAEMKSQLMYKVELEISLEKCFHLILFLRSTIYQLDSDDFNMPNESSEQFKIQNEMADLKEELKSWRVKAKTSNLENAIFRSEVDELKEKIADYEQKKKAKETLNLASKNGKNYDSMQIQSTENNSEQKRGCRLFTRRRKRRKK